MGPLVVKVKIEFLKFYFLALLLLATNTTGFDIYFHAISISNFDLIDYYNPSWVISGYELPRYLFFHYFLWLITCFGIFPLLPILGVLYASALTRAASHHYSQGLIRHAVVVAIVVDIIFTSAVGVSLLVIGMGVLANADKKTSSSYLLICLGSVLHPIGLLAGLFVLLILRGWIYFLLLIVLIYFLHLLTILKPSNFVEYQRAFDFGELVAVNSFIYEKVVDKLSVEVFAIFILFAIYLSLFVISKFREIRFILKQFDRLISIVSVHYVICFLLVVAIARGYPSHLTTGGPLALLSFQHEHLPRETLNIISAAWVSPYFLYDSIKSNQYDFRGD